jgi:tetratricopeptide (TPR) repeat protein
MAALAGVSLVSCITPPPKPTVQATGDALVDGQAQLELAPERDRVLWQYRIAATALRRADFDLARRMLDSALARVQGVFSPDASAKQARRMFSAESKKTFLGEPYERSMAYYYRGIIYWHDGERDNARACFRSAQLMDSDTVDRAYSADYVLLDYLEGVATARLGGDGAPALKRATNSVRNASPPPPDSGHNVLFFVEFGNGPTKYATGEYSQELRFRPGSSRIGSVRIQVGGNTLEAKPIDDLTFQATTRGGRVMDHILANKAVFKSATSTAGNAALIGGAIMATQGGSNSSADEIGAGLIAAGLIAKIISASTSPEADTRTWENLPQYLSLAATALGPGTHPVTVEFLDAGGNALPDLTRSVSIEVLQPPRDTVIFVSGKDR